MHIYCILSWGHRWRKLREDQWLEPSLPRKTLRLLRFEECPHCHVTRATITSPEHEESRYCQPDPLTKYGVKELLPERDWVDRIPEKFRAAMNKVMD